ncbi:hypothetical protein GQ607_005487 [Colletotrichum asianum]|uniref:Uncharacterized protein n=1 Tax=Colletotrichum asianum TaxID=702518 RepID=A0A8H3WFY1_9PEZI|nr:hypothetical protein GQ607_005487 [Colletotrichum asianum]
MPCSSGRGRICWLEIIRLIASSLTALCLLLPLRPAVLASQRSTMPTAPRHHWRPVLRSCGQSLLCDTDIAGRHSTFISCRLRENLLGCFLLRHSPRAVSLASPLKSATPLPVVQSSSARQRSLLGSRWPAGRLCSVATGGCICGS